MNNTCSMQKRKESLAKKSESFSDDLYFHMYTPKSKSLDKIYFRVINPSDHEGWYDVTTEYHDAYECNAELRNGNVELAKVQYDVMKHILSGAIKSCDNPGNTHRNFGSLFYSRPYVITQYQQDRMDGQYDESLVKSSMLKRKESLVKKYGSTVDPDIKKYVDATDRARIMDTLYSFCQEVYDTFKAELEKGTPSSDRYDEIMKEARKIYNKQFADIVEFQMVAAAARSATMAKN